jgi:TolB protein
MQHHNPVWSADGQRVVFSGAAEGRLDLDLFVADVSGETPVKRFGGSSENDYPSHWLPDGTLLTFSQGNRGENIFMFRAGSDSAVPVLRADWNERAPRVSPDGRWLSFVSHESGTDRLYVRRWPELTNRVQVSDGEAPVASSGFPSWSADGRTLYYHQGSRLMAASVDGRGDVLRITSRRTIRENASGMLADLHPDGRRLLFLARETGSDSAAVRAPRRLVVVTNWLSSLRERLGDAR